MNVMESNLVGTKKPAAVAPVTEKAAAQTGGQGTNAAKTDTGTKQTGGTTSAQGFALPAGYSVSGYNPQTDAAYNQAYAALQNALSNTPSYTPTYDAELNNIYSQIVNRDKFSYDLSSDPMYQQYREQYVNQGKTAMMDTMGQAANLTGGYGSSYGQAVGQQQYNNYLQQLNDKVPEFYNMALDTYTREGDELNNKYSVTKDMADTEYGKYRDDVSDYWSNVNFAADRESDAYNRGSENYWNTEQLNSSNYWNSVNMAYDNYWNTMNYKLSAAKAASGTSSSESGTVYKKSGDNTYDRTEDDLIDYVDDTMNKAKAKGVGIIYSKEAIQNDKTLTAQQKAVALDILFEFGAQGDTRVTQR